MNPAQSIDSFHFEGDLSWGLALGLLAFVVVVSGFVAAGLPRRWVLLSTLFRAAALALLVLAAAKPVSRNMRPAALHLSFLLDVSQSISEPEAQVFFEKINEIGRQLHPGDLSRLIIFGRDAREVSQTSGSARFLEKGYEWDGSRTNLASALRTALFRADPEALNRIVLLTDGNQNLDDAAAVLPLVRESQIPVYTYAPRERRGGSSRQPYFEKITVPEQVGTEERFYIHVFLQNPTPRPVDATLKIHVDEQLAAEHRLQLSPGLSPFRLVYHEPRSGIHSVRADLEMGEGASRGFFSTTAFVHVIGKPRVLLVDRDAGRRSFLAGLLQKDFEVEEGEALPAHFPELMRPECIILNDIPTTRFRSGEMDTLARTVQDTGGGLIIIGGDDELGLSSYRKTRLEDVLPVRLDLRSSKGRHDFALVLVIDKSGSMDGVKIEMARRAAIKAVESLESGDVVGVLAFDAFAQWLVPVVTLEENRGPVIELINGLDAGGGTDAKLAMTEVFRELLNRQMNIKQHVVLISDGITQESGFVPLVEQMAQADITVSTVAIGEGANLPLLEDLKRAGKGEFYHVTDPSNLPQIVLEDIEGSMKKVNVIRTEFRPHIFESHPIVRGIDAASLPILKSYSLSQIKPSGNKPLTTNFKNTEDPILATWVYGLGKCSTVLSGLRTGWLGEGTDWKQFGTLWSQLVRWTARTDSIDHPLLRMEMQEDVLRVTIQVPIVESDYPHGVSARLAFPQEAPRPFPLEQKSPFEYHGELKISKGAEVALVIDGYRSVGPWVNAYPLHLPQPAYAPKLPVESPHEKPNLSLLERLTRETGGACEADAATILRRFGMAQKTREYWPALVVLAMFLFLADVALRRLTL